MHVLAVGWGEVIRGLAGAGVEEPGLQGHVVISRNDTIK